MSQVEVDARVKAIQEDLKNGIEVDREELIHNYGLTMDDYERSLERLNKEEMKRTSTQLPLKIKIAKVENSQKERIFYWWFLLAEIQIFGINFLRDSE